MTSVALRRDSGASESKVRIYLYRESQFGDLVVQKQVPDSLIFMSSFSSAVNRFLTRDGRFANSSLLRGHSNHFLNVLDLSSFWQTPLHAWYATRAWSTLAHALVNNEDYIAGN